MNKILLLIISIFIFMGCKTTQEMASPDEDEISKRIEQNKIESKEARERYKSNKREKPASF